MKLPDGSFPSIFAHEPAEIFPPPGFVPIGEAALGDGDSFGLYWPIGLEDALPIVVELRHAERVLLPCFSSHERFQLALDAAYPVPPPTRAEDPHSPYACMHEARQAVARRDDGEARALLESAVGALPEYGDAHALLAGVHQRGGRTDDAVAAALASLRAPPSFGGGSPTALRILVRSGPACTEDPLFRAREALRFRFGGAATNGDYVILRDAIAEYGRRGQLREAVTLLQSYGEWMDREVVAFQQREGFEPSRHRAELRDLIERAGLARLPPTSSR